MPCPDGQVYSHHEGRCVDLAFLSDGAARAVAAYEAAPDAATWYRDAGAFVYDIFGDEPGDLFMRFVAATSVNSEVKRNIRAAIQAVRAFTQGIPYVEAEYAPGKRERFGGYVTQYNRVVEGLRFTNRAIKLSHFDAALRGDPNAVAVDRWVYRYVMNQEGGRTDPDLAPMVVNAVREAAAQLQLQPAELQAMIWWTAITDAGRTPDEFVPLALEWKKEMVEASKVLRSMELPWIPPIQDPPIIGGQESFADSSGILEALAHLADLHADAQKNAVDFVTTLAELGVEIPRRHRATQFIAGAATLALGLGLLWWTRK